ncbi:MAG: TonB-dependent receptor plug domain-containing protein [Saprospiraceae bacterium]|nr:TonB-dependent receptor plug domain-containing protein [Saprospiraceae bacterium]
MKTVWMMLMASLLFVCCQTSDRIDRTANAHNSYLSKYTNLAEALRGSSGLMISGTGDQTRIMMPKAGSVSNREPLYVVDGFPLGTSYRQANRMINMANVSSIRILKNAYELTRYGEQGANGVIEIQTKHHAALK